MDSVNPPALDAALAHVGFVRGLARALLGADPQVEDVVQDTWVVAAQGGPDDPARLKGWLGGIVRRLSAGVIRKRQTERRHHPRVPRKQDAPSTQEVVAREEMRRDVVEAMLALREPYRSALLLRYYEDLPPRTVAARLGVPVETARTRIKRGLALLRAQLDERRGTRAAWTPLVGVIAGLSPAAPAGAGIGMGAVAAFVLVLAAIGAVLGFALLDDEETSDTANGARTEHVDAVDPVDEPAGATLIGRARPAGVQATRIPAGRARVEGFVRRGGRALAADVELRYVGSSPTDFYGRMAKADREVSVRTEKAGRLARADARGRFAFDGLAAGTYVVSVAAPGGAAWTRVVIVPADGLVVDGSLAIAKGAETFTLIARRSDGSPYVGPVHVELRDREKGNPSRANVLASTDAAGQLVVTDLPAGGIFLKIREPGLRLNRGVRLPRTKPLELTVGNVGHLLRGRVTASAEGTPLAGATVRVSVRFSSRGALPWSETRETATDGEGRFELACGEGRGEITVVVVAAGFTTAYFEWDRRDEALEIALTPETSIGGRVVTAGGAGVAGARVIAATIRSNRYLSVAGQALSDERGRFRLGQLRPGDYAVFVHTPGWASPQLGAARVGGLNPFEVEVAANGRGDLKLVVEPLEPVKGRVLDQDGRAIPGARVRAVGQRRHQFRSKEAAPLVELSEFVATDADGRFVLHDVVPGIPWVIEAEGPGIVAVTTPPIAVGKDAKPITIRAVRLDASRDLVVRVLDEADGRPIQGVEVDVVDTQTGGGWSTIRGLSAVTDADGRARITPVPARGAGILLRGPHVPYDDEPKALPPSDAGRTELTFRVPRRYQITGTLTVLPDGPPDFGAFIRIEARRAGSDTVRGSYDEDTGRWRVGPLTKGRWTVAVAASGARRIERTFDAGTADAKLEFEWHWKRPREDVPEPEPQRVTVRYLLVDSDGKKVARATYAEWRGGGTSSGPFRDGERTLIYGGDDVPRHVVEVFGARDARGNRLPFGAVVLPPDAIRAGDTTLTMRKELSIHGRVTVGGKPAPAGARVRASVVVELDGEDRISTFTHDEVATDAQGRFRLRGLGPYRYALVVTGAGGLPAAGPAIVQAGATEVAIDLRTAITAHIVLQDEEGKPLAGIPIRALPAGTKPDPFDESARPTDVNGSMRLEGLDPDQRYRLQVLAWPRRNGVFGIDRPDWSPRDETFRLERAYTLTGIVRAPDGTPVPGALIQAEATPKGWLRVGHAGADGRFKLWSVTAAGHVLKAQRGEQQGESVRAPAGARDVVLVLDPGLDFTVRCATWPWKRVQRAGLSYLAVDASGARVDYTNWSSDDISRGKAELIGRKRALTWTFFWEDLPDGKVGWLDDVQPAHGETIRVPLFDGQELTGRVDIPEGVSHKDLWVNVRVAANARSARPAADGSFRVTGLPPARLEVRVYRMVAGKRLIGPSAFARPGEEPVLQVPVP